ncbi:MAG: S8 family peptidase [Calditrichaceae bacterium]|nr:S8 family peptidase [Calditrichaceae bacterium]RQV96266.1 MAG: T9SS C-terminal target domain-containing protein [Calditrichota bacterium]
MKKFIVLILLFAVSFAFSQHMDVFLKNELRKLEKSAQPKEFHLLVTGDENLADELLKAGIRVQTDLTDRATVIVNRDELNTLSKIPGLKKMIMGPKQRLDNSNSVLYQNVDAAYENGYTGENVICGIIDTGIDFYHPAFRNADGTTRILYIWDQNISGTYPSGYDYGAEFTEAQINSDLTSGTPHSVVAHIDANGHGTHVSGIMAGRDHTTTPADTLHGGAIDANIIFVATTFYNSATQEGIAYIFDKAAALSKPCVVNLSLGSQYGPHDGTDDDPVTIDALTGPGKIVVRSAGNDGSDAVHYYAEDEVSSDAIAFSFDVPDFSSEYVTLWLEEGDNITSVSLAWTGGSITNITQGNQSTIQDVTLALDPAYASNNHQIAAYVMIENEDLNEVPFVLTLNGLSDANSNNTIKRHAWASADAFALPYGGFSHGTAYGPLVHFPYTLGNSACGNNVITVGALVSRHDWVSILNDPGYAYHYNFNGDDGGIANFSSIGPTASGGNKPDIVAGGSILLSARSKDATYSDVFLPKAPYTDNYAYMQGTSMSTPAAAGAIALLMEKNPTWSHTEVLDYLSTHAQGTTRPAGVTEDSLKVKEDPNTWDRVFGYGAIDLTDAFVSSIVTKNSKSPEEFRLNQNYPNPFNPSTLIEFETAQISDVTITIFNNLGQKVKTLVNGKYNPGIHKAVWNGTDNHNKAVASGVYFYEIKTSLGHKAVKKMMLIR